MEKEIHKLINNLNNYFSEVKLETEIKKIIIDISRGEIPALNKKKMRAIL